MSTGFLVALWVIVGIEAVRAIQNAIQLHFTRRGHELHEEQIKLAAEAQDRLGQSAAEIDEQSKTSKEFWAKIVEGFKDRE